MKCNGKCHLKKELQKSESHENNPIKFSEDLQLVLYYSNTPALNQRTANVHKVIYLQYSDNILSDHYFSVFHPPKFA